MQTDNEKNEEVKCTHDIEVPLVGRIEKFFHRPEAQGANTSR
jgi:hypothetical protein